MVADEDDDGALFAHKVVQCVSLAVGRRKPKLRRRRIESDLGGCRRHLAPPCVRNICESVPKFDPSYCRISECYPRVAIVLGDAASKGRPRQVAFPACSTR